MKQIIQNYRTGHLECTVAPVPVCSSDTLLVMNVASLVSIGTERSMIELGKKSLLGKARARPDLMKRFIEKAQKEGLFKTFQEALDRLDQPTALGYSTAGVVVEVGRNVHGFSPGDRVACIGAGYASHAEYIKIPEKLCCRIPDGVTFEEASFGMLGIIALNGIRLARLTFGEFVAVLGLGLLGLLSVQILKAYGCRVIGMDLDPAKIDLASRLGADVVATEPEFKKSCEVFSEGHGVDAVILTVASHSDAPVHAAVDVCRFGGRVVCVGVVDIHPSRNEMWHKEVEIVVSRAGGPGTFDPLYENKGIDFPMGFVRWTENRNLAEFLRLIGGRKVDVRSLISHRFSLEKAEAVYGDILENRGGPYIGVVLEYPNAGRGVEAIGDRLIRDAKAVSDTSLIKGAKISLGVIGAGLYGKALLLPALKKIPNFDLRTLAAASSANASHTAKKYSFSQCTTDYRQILDDRDVQAVVILTPHSLHARMVVEALKEGKHVFVEKPLCVTEGELAEIRQAYGEGDGRLLMVGYNRRFSSHAAKMEMALTKRQDPMVIHYRVNAGFVPADHWVHSEAEGGGRIIGEVCHFVDFMQFMTKSHPVRVYAERVSGNNNSTVNSDNVVITLKFADGSVGDITYAASGDKAFSREQIEIFSEGMTIVSSDFKQTLIYRDGKKHSFKTMGQEMGYREELQHFCDVITGKVTPQLTAEEVFYSTQTVFSINTSIERNLPISIVLPPIDRS
jgi:predicted dehydrogenase/threonine dehydrogenase-like Zn-dependent dehydrogenase